MNAWDLQLGHDLRAALDAVAADEGVRAVCLTGAGRAFSSGADLRALEAVGVTPSGRPDVHRLLTEHYNPIIERVRALPKPVVAALNGPAVGIGLSLALSADLVVARESAYLLLAFVNIGLVPDGGASCLIPERIGLARATEMAMLGERVGAQQAADWGLINRAIPDEAFDDEVAALLARLAAGPTGAYAGIKQQLNAWLFERLSAQLALEADLQQEAAERDDFQEGVAAFIEKRTARFTGA
jgi:2-(1,2-epoxy-1,2-dihydrophenyl)acetyl-CoA isomerase